MLLCVCVCAGGGSWKRWPSTRCWWSTRTWWSSTGPGRRIAYSTFKWSCVNSGRYIISFLDDGRMLYIEMELWELKPKLGGGMLDLPPPPAKVSSLFQKVVFSRTVPMPICSLKKCLCFSLSQCVIQWQSVYVSVSEFHLVTKCSCFSLSQCVIQ